MKHVALAAVVFVIGLILGGLGPRSQLRGLEVRVAELEDQDCKGGIGKGLATMFGDRPIVDSLDEEQPRAHKRPAPEPSPEPEASEGDPTEEPPRAEAQVKLDFGDAKDMDPEEAIGLARDAMELRRTQARAALVEDAGADEEQLADFDDAVARMNEGLFGLAEAMVSRVESGQEMGRRDAMVFAADALDIMIGAEDDIQAVFDPEQLEDVEGEAVDPFSYVDPALVDMLMLLDDRE